MSWLCAWQVGLVVGYSCSHLLPLRVRQLSWSAVPVGTGRFLSVAIDLRSASLVYGSLPGVLTAPHLAQEALSLRDSPAMSSYDFILLASGFLSRLSRMAATVGLRVGCLQFLALFVSFLDGLNVSLFCKLLVHY